MTNGEKIIAILKPRKDQIRIYDNWVEIEIQKLGINFSCELNWWNTECNEPTRIDLRVDAISSFVNAKVDEGDFPDHCSTAGLEEYDEEEKDWVTWYDEKGHDFDEHFERR